MSGKYLDQACPYPGCGEFTVPPYDPELIGKVNKLFCPPCESCGRKARVQIFPYAKPDVQGCTHGYVLFPNGNGHKRGGSITFYASAENFSWLKGKECSETVNAAIDAQRDAFYNPAVDKTAV